MRHKLTTLRLSILVILGAACCACSPRVEYVSYAEYDNQGKNCLEIDVNTYRGLFKGRESFLHFKRDIYFVYFETKNRTHAENDTEIWLGHKNIAIRPEQGTVKILDDPHDGVVVIVDLKDERVPTLLNGEYRMKLVSDTRKKATRYPSQRRIFYEMKK